MNRSGLSAVGSATEINFLHLLAGRGIWVMLTKIMAVSDSGGFDQYHLTKAFWIDLMNVKRKNDGRGCVDLAFGCNVEEAKALKRWGAKEQAPPPPPHQNQWNQGGWRTQASGQGGDGDPAPASGSGDPWANWKGTREGSNHGGGWQGTREGSNHGGGRSSAGSNDWHAAFGQVRGNVRRRKRREDVVGQYDHKTGPAELRAFGMYKYDDEVVTRNNHLHFSSDEEVGEQSESDNSTTQERYARRH